MENSLKFPNVPKARANFSSGTIYAVSVGEYIFYCQVAENQSFGFFKVRTSELLEIEDILKYPIMSRFGISRPSLGFALKEGIWKKIGKGKLAKELEKPAPTVQWPVGDLTVSIWFDGEVIKETSAFDPNIQSYELIMAYDASSHVPERLTVDYDMNPEQFEFGGSVWRMRKLKEHLAKKFPDAPYHQLPTEWVYT
jgi:hypothetical protein